MSGNLRQRGENLNFHFPFLCLFICPSAMLCGMLSAASPRHICSNARMFLQGHCLHDNFACLSCTSNHSALCTSTFELHLKTAAELGLKAQRWRKDANPASHMQLLVPRARRSAGTVVPGLCRKCYAVHCMDNKAGENSLPLHRRRLECVGVERERVCEPEQPSTPHLRMPSCCFQFYRGSVQLNLCIEMRLWAAAAQSWAAEQGPC